MSDTILAIDPGGYKGVRLPSHDVDPQVPDHRYPAEVDSLQTRHPGAVVVVGACANAGWVHDRAVVAGRIVKVANTAAVVEVHAF